MRRPRLWYGLIAFLSCAYEGMNNPHQPKTYTWEIVNQAGDVANSTVIVSSAIPWPNLEVDLCKLALGADAAWGTPSEFLPKESPIHNPGKFSATSSVGPGCHTKWARSALAMAPIYVCPGPHRPREWARSCGSSSSYFCASWSCLTTGDVYWNPTSTWDYITIRRKGPIPRGTNSGQSPLTPECATGNWCNPLSISFTPKGKEASLWGDNKGKEWGLQLYVSGKDPGLTFRIRLKTSIPSSPVGPNPVLVNQGPPRLALQPLPPPVPSLPKLSPPLTSSSQHTNTSELHPPMPHPGAQLPTTGDKLFNLILGAFEVLNHSTPNNTESCWLCLTASPPYYEGIATLGNFSVSTSHDQCAWQIQGGLTISEVSGSGLCLGTVPLSHRHLCAQNATGPFNPTDSFLKPPNGTWWACNTGLTPCVAASVFNSSRDYCILIHLWPKISYHDASEFEGLIDRNTARSKREFVSLTLAVLLGLRITTGIGTGTTALITQNQGFLSLQAAIDEDIKDLQHSLEALEKSLTSLSEVVLQNRRGLDLLFLKEGGLCAALKEECCFYADHTGVARDSLQKLKERLTIRQKNRETQSGWFESWFSRSPWLTTLISTVAGPLILFLLLLTFGPWAFRKLTTFVKQQIDQMVAKPIQVHYYRLEEIDHNDSCQRVYRGSLPTGTAQ